MSAGHESSVDEFDRLMFRLLSIERHAPPAGGDGNNWFVYKISQGDNVITGYRCGSIGAVTEGVRKVVEGLNERRGVRRGRADLVTRSGTRPAAASASST
jgi:hypothetical protein